MCVSGTAQSEYPTREGLAAALKHALMILDAYAFDCRNISDYLDMQGRGGDGQGFCQGRAYADAIPTMLRHLNKQNVSVDEVVAELRHESELGNLQYVYPESHWVRD